MSALGKGANNVTKQFLHHRHQWQSAVVSSSCHGSNSYSTSADINYLQKSRVRTDKFQKGLPRLPVPKLEDTCERYLKAQTPLLTTEEYKTTEKIVADFKNGEGKELHDSLVSRDKQNKHTNYVTGPWTEMYLKDRRAVALNHNPFMAFNDDPKAAYNDPLVRSTNFVVSSLRFMRSLRENTLEPEVFHLNPKKSDTEMFRTFVNLLPDSIAFYGAAIMFKAYALDMSQYPRLFNGTRIPRPEKDEIFSAPDARNLVVMRKGHIYSFDVLDAHKNIRAPAEILGLLQQVAKDPRPAAGHPVGVLTSQHRDIWSAAREQLVTAGNADTLRELDSALFVLALDDSPLDDPIPMSRAFLHGNGSNRWFDKSFSLLVAGDGKASVNFEHAWGDGVAVLRWFNEVFKDTTTNPHVNPDTTAVSCEPAELRRLDFKLTDALKATISEAQATFDKAVSELDIDVMQYHAHGKKDIKRFKLSPDSFLQFAIQLAYYRQFGNTVATYESCSTAAFKHGRTETIRPATVATKRACELFEKAGTRPSLSELKQSLKECSDLHGKLTKEAAMGQGFDRHLFGLRNLAAERGNVPAIFQDPAYARINHNILSTSTLSSPAVLLGGFAPVVPDGFGVGYGVEDDYLGCNVTSYPNNAPHRDVHQFVQGVNRALADMFSVLNDRDFK